MFYELGMVEKCYAQVMNAFCFDLQYIHKVCELARTYVLFPTEEFYIKNLNLIVLKVG